MKMRIWQVILFLGFCLLTECIEGRRKTLYLKRSTLSRQGQQLLPLFRSLNEFVNDQTAKQEEQDANSFIDANYEDEKDLEKFDNSDEVTDMEDEEEMPISNKMKPRRLLKKPSNLMLVKTTARENSENGRTLKHLFLLKGLTGGLAAGLGNSAGYNSGIGNGGYTIPYIIINNPTNVTNLNNNNLTNLATAGTGTGTGTGGGRILMPQAMIMPVQVPSENLIRRYEKRQNVESPSGTNVAAMMSNAAAFIDFQGNIIPLPMLQNIPSPPEQTQRLRKVQQQKYEKKYNYNPFSFLGNGFKGIEYL